MSDKESTRVTSGAPQPGLKTYENGWRVLAGQESDQVAVSIGAEPNYSSVQVSAAVTLSPAVTLRIGDRHWHAACVRSCDPGQGHTGSDHLLLMYSQGAPPPKGKLPALPAHALPVRIHSECLFGDVFSGDRCDCGVQLDAAMGRIVDHGYGIILYLRQEGRGIGLFDKVRSLLQEGDTYERNVAIGVQEDARGYEVAAQVLRQLDVNEVRLLSGNPEKVAALVRSGISVSVDPEINQPLSQEAAGEVMAKMSRGYSYCIKDTVETS